MVHIQGNKNLNTMESGVGLNKYFINIFINNIIKYSLLIKFVLAED